MADDTPVLFLGGAGLPSWVWDEVRAELPGPTAVLHCPRASGTSLADYADAAATQAPWPTFAVVAHSIGGVIAASLLARHPGRVAGVLGVAAVVPRAGRSFVGALPLPARLLLPVVLRVAGTRPPAKTVRDMARGLPDEVADRVVAQFDPESVRLFLDRTPPRRLPAARGYLRTTRDAELPEAVQRASADELQAAWTEELPTGHLPMLQDAAAISGAVRRLLAHVDG